ncbi:flavodoxin domain-containing protein [Bradyrhizobium sp.]|uniref:flavodoxin domain-containing protein n=1 Tax=Bradyrhizobium sp. TaxID=376 RepID=UPI003C5AE7D8
MELFYATRDGQSRRIAERIAAGLAVQGIRVLPQDLAIVSPGLPSLAAVETGQAAGRTSPAAAQLVVLVAAVRYGLPLPEAEQFLARYRKLSKPPQLVLLSVNLTARKPGKDTAQGNVYLRKSIARHRLDPVFALAIAGRLDYARYGFWDRQLIRFIMRLTGGPTDPATSIEYTPWPVVDEVALRIAALHGRIAAPAGPNESTAALNFDSVDPGQLSRAKKIIGMTAMWRGGTR